MKKTLLPIQVLILFLLLLAVWSSIVWNSTDVTAWLLSLRNLVLLSGASFLVRFLLRNVLNEGLTTRYEHRLITLLILYLLFDTLLPWWIFVLLGAVTELGQDLIRTKLGPLFNPAALGGLILSCLGYLPSWWGANPAPRLPLLGVEISVIAWIMALGAGYVAYRYRKLPVTISAFLAFGLSYLVFFQANPAYLLLEGTFFFFLFVMLVEPKTSPVIKQEQIVYGILVGALVPLGLYYHFIEASFIALLIGNLYTGRRFLLAFLTTNKAASLPQS